MAIQKRSGRTQKAAHQTPRRRPGRGSEAPRHVPEPVVALRRHAAGFAAWADRTRVHGEETDAERLWDGIEMLLAPEDPRTPVRDPARMTPDQLQALLDGLGQEGWGPDHVGAELDALVHLLEYFTQMRLWRGSPEDLAGCQELLAELASDSNAAVVETLLAGVESDPDQEASALADLALTGRFETLLRWVDSGPRGARAVTVTGSLRRADLPAVAALVGVELSTARDEDDAWSQHLRDHQQLDLDLDPPSPPAPRSMSDVPPLARLWQTCRGLDLVDVGATRARVGGLGQVWLRGSERERRDARAMAATSHLVLTLSSWPARGAVAALRSQLTTGVLLSLLLDGLPGGLPGGLPDRVEGGSAGGADRPVTGAGSVEMARLAHVGVVVDDGGGPRIRPGLEGVVAVALRLFLYDGGAWDAEGRAP